MFRSGKVYTHAQGLSCCFRQWRAKDSHCKYLHGYSLQFELMFMRQNGGLDDRNWVMGFGDLKTVKKWLEASFDHKTLVSSDDPDLRTFQFLEKEGLIQLRIVKAIGVESFAQEVFLYVKKLLAVKDPGVKITQAIVREHEGNWALYSED